MLPPDASDLSVTPPVGAIRPSVETRFTRPPQRRSSLAALTRWVVLGLFVIGTASIIVATIWRPKPRGGATVLVVTDPPEAPAKLKEPPLIMTPGLPANGEDSQHPERHGGRSLQNTEHSAPHPKLGEVLAQIERGIVKIESGGPAGHTSLGSGFVIDASGLIATNHHVIDEATQGVVRFKDGAAYEIAGYAAVAQEQDLAILRLKDPPPSLFPLRLRFEDDPPQLAAVVAIGHPRGLAFSPFDGKVSRVLLTRELPSASQQFLSRHLSGPVDLRWIQHTAGISQGNSGGPLINERGEVIGVNTWVDNQTDFGYALHARYVARLRGRLFEETAPLEKFASKEARTDAAAARLSVERVGRLLEDCQALKWRPASAADYATLQELAWAVTYPRFSGNLGGAKLDAALLDDLSMATDRVEARLKAQKSEVFGEFTLINELAADQITRPLAGLFFFGTVERIVEGDNGARGLLMKLAGFDQVVFLPLDGNLFSAAPGTHCLVLGVNANGRVVRYGDNPLKLITAPVIVSRTILPLDD